MGDADEMENVLITPDIQDPDLLPEEEPFRKSTRGSDKRVKKESTDTKSIWNRLAENKTTVIIVVVVVIVLIVLVFVVLKFWSKEPEDVPPQSQPPATQYAPGMPPPQNIGGAPHQYPHEPAFQKPVAGGVQSAGITHEALAQHVPREALQRLRDKMQSGRHNQPPPPRATPTCEELSSDDEHADSSHDGVQHNSVQHNSVQHNSVQHNSEQHNSVQHNSEQHNSEHADSSHAANAPNTSETDTTPEVPPQDAPVNPEWYRADTVNRDGLCAAVTTTGGYCRNKSTAGDKCGKHRNG